MNASDTEVLAIIERQGGTPTTDPDMTLDDAGLDSLDILGVVMEVEDAFGLRIADDRWSLTTPVATVLSDVADMVMQH